MAQPVRAVARDAAWHAACRQRIRDSQESVDYLATFFARGGHHTYAPRIIVNENADIRDYDHGDLWVNGACQEVKRWGPEKESFTCAQDFPYKTWGLLIIRDYRWQNALQKPEAFYILNHSMKNVAIVPASTFPHWDLHTYKPDNAPDEETGYFIKDLRKVKFVALTPATVLHPL